MSKPISLRMLNPVEYSTWQHMIYRCTRPNIKAYKHYGGRGIKVCPRWLENFANFLEDMGNKPTPKHTLDRIDNSGDYEPNNCRWSTMHTQNANRRHRRPVTGVRYQENYPSKPWLATLMVDGVWVLRKSYSTHEEAYDARKAAEQLYLR